jgi:hypothetical protein
MNQILAFTAAKEAIASTTGLEWIQTFDTTPSVKIEETAKIAIQKNDALMLPVFEPMLCEAWLEDCAAIVDRALELKRMCGDLEAIAVRQGLDYLAQRDLARIDADIHVEGVVDGDASELSKGLKAATDKLTASADPLAAGLAAEATARGNAATSTSARESRRRTLLAARLEYLEEHQQKLFSRHWVDGSALNYAQRYEDLLLLLEDDVKLLVAKAFAASIGLENVYGFKESVPPASKRFLEEILFWIRRAFTLLHRQRARDAQYQVMVPLVASWGSHPGIVSPAQFSAAMIASGDGVLRFNIGSDRFPNQKRVRLRSVGLQWLGPGIVPPVDSTVRIAAHVFPPDVRMTSDGSEVRYRRPPLILHGVTPYTDSVVSWTGENECHNVSPIGDWTIRVLPTALNLTPTALSRNLTDLCLHLLVVSEPEVDPQLWVKP